jgi:protoporphyrinogen oxidase
VAGRVPDAPIDDVLKAAIGVRTEGYTHQALFYYPKKGGFQAITDGIASTLLDRVRVSTPAADLVRQGEGWQVNGEEFDAVVSTLPLDLLPEVAADVPRDVAEAMRGLEYNSLTSVLVALDRPEHPDLSWIYLPHPDQGPANRVTYMSNYSPGNAPAGRTSLLCEVTSPGGQPYPGPEAEEEIVAGLARAGLLRRDEILFTDRSSTAHAYVVFDHGYAARRRAALEWMESVGLFALGRFGRYEYDNSDQCVVKSRALAGRLLGQAVAG